MHGYMDKCSFESLKEINNEKWKLKFHEGYLKSTFSTKVDKIDEMMIDVGLMLRASNFMQKCIGRKED